MTATPVDAPRLVCFYLPQFHPIAVNDRAWGPGFTEWHNVVAARPRFRNHRQPVLPADLGFYDLRLAETRIHQAELARSHGIAAFCWYHYWFDGERVLNEPFDRMSASSDETFPFLLCWANESWTRNWSGHSGKVIIRQRYSPADDERHARWLVDVAFADPRYLTIDGRPVFLVYQPNDLPSPAATCEVIRRTAVGAGLREPVILAVSSFRSVLTDARAKGFDGVVPQQPDLNVVRPAWRAAPRYLAYRARLTRQQFPRIVRADYGRVASAAMKRIDDRETWPTVCPRWDNTPRRARGAVVLQRATPDRYESWLRSTLQRTNRPLVFVNAWNEWGEGAHLEPDAIYGRAFLEATRRATAGLS